MKTRNIIAVLSIVCAMVMTSCSADDALDEMGSQNMPASSEVVAVACNISTGATTRAEETEDATTKEAAITNAIFFLVKDNEVLGSADYKSTIYTKGHSDVKLIAIANASDATRAALLSMTSTSDIYAQVLSEADLNSLIKISEPTSIPFSNGDKVTVEATVNQVAARIDLVSCIINKQAADNVTLKGVSLVNQQIAGALKGASSAPKFNPESIAGTAVNDGSKLYTGLYTFANAESASKKVALELTFDVDGETVTKEVTIKHNGVGKVEAGYVYRLKLTATVIGKNIVPSVTFVVSPWIDRDVSADMEEVSN